MSAEVLAMSDEDFLKLDAPPAPEAGGASSQEVETGTPTPEEVEANAAADAEVEAQRLAEEEAAHLAAENAATGKDTSKDGKLPTQETSSEQTKGVTPANEDVPATAQVAKDTSEKVSKEGEDLPSGSKAEGQDGTPPDYEGFYKKIMSPLKANGKTIDLKSPEEAIQLMQMGANYTRKMQALAPHRKVLMMLENNGLLDEGQLSFAIDLVKKDPNAIRKLIKDAGIDPLDIDTNAEVKYNEGNHRVSDEEATFVSALDDLRSSQGGTETLNIINSQWDQASKEVLWKNPQVMQIIHEQRSNGIYDRIVAEVDRQKTLGILPAQEAFLESYKKVGDQLTAVGAFNDLVQAPAPTPQATAPVVTRVQAPKPIIKNGDKVSAATPTRSTPKTAQPVVNPLAMSDDEFMKTMAISL